MTKAKDLIGKRYGRLIVLSRNFEKQEEIYKEKGVYKAYWNCKCDCGNTAIVSSCSLNNKISPTKSCGCYADEVIHKQKNTKSNKWIIKSDKNIVIGFTSKGEEFYIDTDDYEKARQYCWRFSPHGYVIANSRNGSNKIIWLHRLILGINDNTIIVDHKDWNKANNLKSNLRIATKSENNINIRRKSNNTTGYTGVTLNKRSGKYIARISINGQRIYLGTFDSLEEAVIVRHEAEIKIHKEWSGELNRHDFTKVIKDNSDQPDMEEAEELIEEE